MKLVLEGNSLAEIGLEAQRFIDDLVGDDDARIEAAPTNGGASPVKRGRGRPTKAAQAAAASEAAIAAGVTAAPPAQLPNGQPVTDAAARFAAPPTPKVEDIQAAMRKLIDHAGHGVAEQGAPFAAKLLRDEFSPATRATEIPQSEWPRFLLRVAAITHPAKSPTAGDLV